MKAYILSIAGVVLLAAVITIIAPGGKMGKFLKGAVKLVILFVMVSPLVSIFSEGEFAFETAQIGTDEEYLAHCADQLSEEDEAAIIGYLSEEYGVTAEAQVNRRADGEFSYEKILIKITDFGIIGQDEHIHISEEIEKMLEARYGCDAEVT